MNLKGDIIKKERVLTGKRTFFFGDEGAIAHSYSVKFICLSHNAKVLAHNASKNNHRNIKLASNSRVKAYN